MNLMPFLLENITHYVRTCHRVYDDLFILLIFDKIRNTKDNTVYSIKCIW